MEPKKFDDIKKYIEDHAIDKNSLWLIGERKWIMKLSLKILEAEKIEDKLGERAETGVFLTEKINWVTFEEKFKDCIRLVFFNPEEQFQFIAIDNKSDLFTFYHSKLEKNGNNLLNLKNVTDESNGNFQFGFARRLGTIPKLDKEIQVIVNKETGEWRLRHE